MHEMLSHLVSPTSTQTIKTWTIDGAMTIQQKMWILYDDEDIEDYNARRGTILWVNHHDNNYMSLYDAHILMWLKYWCN
jgi:hypothetical protein